MNIDKGVPFPRKGRRGARYPWLDMESGDSLFVSTEDDPQGNNLRTAMQGWLGRHRPGWKVSGRKEGDGTRVWMFAPEDAE